ncbi:ATP-grasp domain-containing protein [Mesorhizobium sp. SP-1A]|uniref:carboxylate--amine ligase n=1 Tax=Mesorhizobium sp. SP-1A TaxID=3077840 RepID=UPI0028F74C8B|nr:ATP-grasp domain-containing protein [Mesorhizobium sp. SP-1A]
MTPDSRHEKDNPGSPGAIPGVVILGGAHGTLALARSLGAQKVPVWLVSNDTPLPGRSRHISGKFGWRGENAADAAGFLLELAGTAGLSGALLVAGGDTEVRLVSQAAETLAGAYRLTLPPWERLKWVCEKPLLYRRAAELGLNTPLTYEFASLDEASGADIRFPVVLKPNMGGSSRFQRAKVVRADDRASFLTALSDAAEQIGLENVVVQQLIPGGGECQFSYAALWNEGEPVAEFTARRTRQYPVEFGYTSTFVEAMEVSDAAEAARLLLRSIRHHGLVEIEFKRDPRDGVLRVLDVNPRPWSWFGLAKAAGVDLGAMMWDVANSRPARPAAIRSGAAWMYLVRDLAAAAQLRAQGKLTTGSYARALGSVRSWAAFAGDDPVPGLIDIPLTAWRVLTRRILR